MRHSHYSREGSPEGSTWSALRASDEGTNKEPHWLPGPPAEIFVGLCENCGSPICGFGQCNLKKAKGASQ